MLLEGEYVKVTGGIINSPHGMGPIPKSLRGVYAKAVKTGKKIDTVIEPGSVWGCYETTSLETPVDELKLMVVSEGPWKDELLDATGMEFSKLTPIELLAVVAD